MLKLLSKQKKPNQTQNNASHLNLPCSSHSIKAAVTTKVSSCPGLTLALLQLLEFLLFALFLSFSALTHSLINLFWSEIEITTILTCYTFRSTSCTGESKALSDDLLLCNEINRKIQVVKHTHRQILSHAKIKLSSGNSH